MPPTPLAADPAADLLDAGPEGSSELTSLRPRSPLTLPLTLPLTEFIPISELKDPTDGSEGEGSDEVPAEPTSRGGHACYAWCEHGQVEGAGHAPR